VKHPAPAPPPDAAEVFGSRLDLARRYADALAGAGVEWGLIGPREVERIWERHILNCAAVADLIPPGARVIDIGSGAGLPGLPVAIARPDLKVTLVESMRRRTDFLKWVVDDLAAGDQVDVVRGRAEDPAVRTRLADADAVVSRAVADLEKLTRWSLPLLRSGGLMLALKGEQAEAEVAQARTRMTALGAGAIEVVRCGHDSMPPVTVVVARKVQRALPGQRARSAKRVPERRRP